MSEKIFMTWDQFNKDITAFVTVIKNYDFDKNSVILALKRGGFTTACTLSNKLGIPISTVSYQTRDGSDSKPRFLEPEMIKKDTKIIIPDDIYDTGVTVNNIIKELITTFGIDKGNIMGLFHYGSDEIHNIQAIWLSLRNNHGSWVVMPWE